MQNSHILVDPIPHDIQQTISLIASQLGIDQNQVPSILTPRDTGKVLDTSTNTLSVWRSTGRYNLPFIKVGRKIRYPIIGIAEFMKERTFTSTGEFENAEK